MTSHDTQVRTNHPPISNTNRIHSPHFSPHVRNLDGMITEVAISSSLRELEPLNINNESLPYGWWIRTKEVGSEVPKNRRSISSTVWRVDRKETRRLKDPAIQDDEPPTPNPGETLDPQNHVPPLPSPESPDPQNHVPSLPSPEPPDPLSDNNLSVILDSAIPSSDKYNEHMLITGGFSDTDWTTFPVLAYDITSASLYGKGKWISFCCGPSEKNPSQKYSGLQGRVGHMSAIWDGYLYIFGGLMYHENLFQVEDDIRLHRCKLDFYNYSEELEWEIIVPTIEGESEGFKFLPRGEAQGGVWLPDEEERDAMWIIHGGLHVLRSPSTHHSNFFQVDVPQGDVWGYSFLNNTFYPLYAASDVPNDGPSPIERTAHAGTILGNSLLIYGGMSLNLDSWSTTQWNMLGDVWAFDLVERRWKERVVAPPLIRSYHSLVGLQETDEIVAFGGYRTAETVAGDAIYYVFDDTLKVNVLDQEMASFWHKAEHPEETKDSSEDKDVSNRLEHTAVVVHSQKQTKMFVWGGRYKVASQIEGMWSLDVSKHSGVKWIPAEADGLDTYGAEIETLHLLVAVMMFMSVLFTALYGTLRRQAEENATHGRGGTVRTNNGGFMRRSGRGLSPANIATLPTKIFSKHNEEDEEDECCPICLVEYENEEELRNLPACNHDFHKNCVDSWLAGNASCPACRTSVREVENNNTADDSSMGNENGFGGFPHGRTNGRPGFTHRDSRNNAFRAFRMMLSRPVSQQNSESGVNVHQQENLDHNYISSLELTVEATAESSLPDTHPEAPTAARRGRRGRSRQIGSHRANIELITLNSPLTETGNGGAIVGGTLT